VRASGVAIVALATLCACLAGCDLSSATSIDEVACPSGGTELSYENFGQDFLGRYCQRCHASTASPRNGAPEAYVFDTLDDVRGLADRIFLRAAGQNTSMPPGPDDPPLAERQLLAEWLACGAPADGD
jgi:uncharacterized membrane protein